MFDNKYNINSIKTLKGLEAVRKRPGMYIGAVDENGLHHLIWEILDNSFDEVLSKYANTISLTITKNNSIIIEDNGRGIPPQKHPTSKLTGIELVFSQLHAGAKFDEKSGYRISSGLHGVGASVVNALSKKVVITVYFNKQEYLTIFEDQKLVQPTKVVGKTSKKGTKVEFFPDFSIFKNLNFNFEKIKIKLQESSYLMPNLVINYSNEITKEKITFSSSDGLKDFLLFLSSDKKLLVDPIYFSNSNAKTSQIIIDFAFLYHDNYDVNLFSFVNNVKTIHGGTHEQGLISGLIKSINEYTKQNNLIKNKNLIFESSDIKQGLVAIISLRVPENLLSFVGQTKEALKTPEIKNMVENFIFSELTFWLNENKSLAQKIIEKITFNAEARIMIKKAKLDARDLKKVLQKDKIFLSNKLTVARSKIPSERELFLVEGNSAGGSAKGARDAYFQAILPLRGKIINVEKSKLSDILKNEEIITIINTLNTGIMSEFNIKNLAYEKVIIMTDADTDGAHIQVLLLTFFNRYMKPLISEGHIFIAKAPLYKLTLSNKKYFYAWDEKELKALTSKYSNFTIQRYKGLGEMNAQQLWDTTMNPQTRKLIKVSLKDLINAEKRISILMGNEIELRKNWINNNIDFNIEDNFIKFKEN
ncbi:MAG: type IIA DNA topoisomerase subunit B [Mycoplasma sp.]|nr:type IIA DNA topoisomerase subunit B [Mycoplasma sp.]